MAAVLMASTVLSMVVICCGTIGIGNRLLEPIFQVTSPLVGGSGNWSYGESRAAKVQWRIAGNGKLEAFGPTLEPSTTLDKRFAAVNRLSAGSHDGAPDVTLGPAMGASGKADSGVEAEATGRQGVASSVRPIRREMPVPVLKDEAFYEPPRTERKTCVDAGEPIYAGRHGVSAGAAQVHPEGQSGCVEEGVMNAPVALGLEIESDAHNAANLEPREYAMAEPLPAEELQEVRGGFRVGGVEFSFAVFPRAGLDGATRPVSVYFGGFQIDIPKLGGQFTLVDHGNAGAPPLVGAGDLPAGRSVNGQLGVVIQNFHDLVVSPMAQRVTPVAGDRSALGLGFGR